MPHVRPLQAAAIGAVATVLVLATGGVTPLDHAVYTRWRRPPPPSDRVLVVSDETQRVLADHAALGRLINRLSRAGAAAIAVDIPRAIQPGAASEALLRQSIAQAGNVVVARSPEADAGGDFGARAVGHTAVSRTDGPVGIPVFVAEVDRRRPALGLAAAAVAVNAEPPIEGGVVMVNPSGRLTTIALAELSGSAPGDDAERLRALVGGKIVVLLGGSPRADAMRLHAELASAVLTGATLASAPAWSVWIATLAVAVAAAWLWLALRWWAALGLTLALGLAVAVGAALLLRGGVMAPVTVPLGALAVAAVGALAWTHVGTRGRLRGLESELAAMREALARQESTVETLEEDLEAARSAVERSAAAERAADALRAQLETARRQEEDLRERLEVLARESRPPRETTAAHDACARVGIATRDPVMLALFRDLEKAARSALPILITGEPGTGKELFARAAHRLSGRAGKPFVAVNMAAVPPELFESELFGHVRGSFTGAVADRKGWFEQADGGTIFLDEVGELRSEHQSKLLRVLQEKSFHRVGATRPTSVDVRVVAATNRDLERAVADGRFREDLYFRLKGLVLPLPPLRNRRADIPLLAARMLEEAAAEMKRPGLALSEAAVAALERHDWPGNVRELQNCLRQAAALADRDVLAPADLRLPGAPSPAGDARDSDATVLAALRRHRFDMQATARALGWDRSTVTQRLKGLGFRALVEARGDAGRAAQELAADPALTRTVEVKLREYHEHLLRTVESCDSLDAAVIASRRRFKNLPERHFRSLETLLQLHFDRRRV